jgi:RNA polymerase sigma factor (sigma-70 family)
MAHAPTSPIGGFLRRLSVSHLAAAVADDELVHRFVVHREEAAFAALVRRHGPLVLGVCRRVLADRHAAEDCFQATFLVLARKAGSLKRPEALGPWLYGVATRTALKARARAARRLVCERRACVAEAVLPADELAWRDVRPKLDAAIAGLPEKYRAPFVMHHLEGLTVAEVAHRLGCPEGTAAVRLARAKERLRARLARQGLAWCAGALALGLARGASAAVPAPLATATVQAALGSAAGQAAGALSATAVALTTGGLHVMSVSKGKAALAVLVAVSALGVGVGVSRYAGPDGGHASAGLVSRRGGGEGSQRRAPGGTVPVFERFYAGGFRSMRGFEYREVPPNAGRSPCAFQDILVRVQEQRTGSLIFGVGVNSDAGLTGSILLNERNFDITRRPTSVDDLLDGHAFRGAGQELRIEAVPGTRVTLGRKLNEAWSDFPGAGPTDPALGFKPGGDFLFLNSIEYQVPVRTSDPLYLVAFVDSGTVKRSAGGLGDRSGKTKKDVHHFCW